LDVLKLQLADGTIEVIVIRDFLDFAKLNGSLQLASHGKISSAPPNFA
jgi:hypothetical protein